MKLLGAFFLLFLVACNPESSPDGRSRLRDHGLQAQIDSMQEQHQLILDSLSSLSTQIKALQQQTGIK